MSIRLSDLFGKDIFTVDGERKGKVFDLVINLEKGRLETITTEPLKVKSKQEARKIISEKSIPYKKVVSAKDIVVVNMAAKTTDEPAPATQSRQTYYKARYKPR